MGQVDIFDQIIHDYNYLTKCEVRIADYILKHKQNIQNLNILDLAQCCGVSEASISRFCHKMNYSGFTEFRMALVQAVTIRKSSHKSIVEDPDVYGEINPEDSISQKCQKLYTIGTHALSQTLSLMDANSITFAVDLLLSATNVYCFGQGNSSIVAMDAWGRFTSVTAKFHWIADSHMQAYTASLLQDGDVILYFSFSGATQQLLEIGALKQNTDAKLILVTRYPNAPGVEYADVTLLCGANESPRQQGSIAAKIGQLFIIDVLYNEFCARDFDATIRNHSKTIEAASPSLP